MHSHHHNTQYFLNALQITEGDSGKGLFTLPESPEDGRCRMLSALHPVCLSTIPSPGGRIK